MPLNKIRQGFTLIEILIALTMTLIVLGAMTVAFRFASGEITRGRALMELSNQLRIVQDTMRNDLDGVTVDVRPHALRGNPNGYFEIIEGAARDFSRDFVTVPPALNANTTPGVDAVIGDVDDMIAMTVRAEGRPFRGRFNGEVIESNVAEVVWWTSSADDSVNVNTNDYDVPITLHRRVLLIRPDLAPTVISRTEDIQQFYLLNDVSIRIVDVGSDGQLDLVPNSLADLSKRENRFAHQGYALGGVFPFPLRRGVPGSQASLGDLGLHSYELSAANMNLVNSATGNLFAQAPDLLANAGDDIMLSDVMGFDIQVYSPRTPLHAQGGSILEPDDRAYPGNPAATAALNGAEVGAFVDIGYLLNLGNNVPYDPGRPEFSTFPRGPGFSYAEGMPASTFLVYDTLSKHYETDGVDNDNDGVIDESFDGFDSVTFGPGGATPGGNGVDDDREREAFPPYPDRLRGVRITFRAIERSTRQTRQTEVITSFLPQ